MRFHNIWSNFALGALAAVAAFGGIGGSVANAQIRITEIWQRGSASTTPDWFEITNVGAASIDPSTFYYDDDSANPEVNARLAGVTSLAPGESAVYLVSWHDDFPGSDFPPPFDPTDALAAFESFWGATGAYQVGHILDGDTGGGPGLGGGGDAVNIFDGNTAGANLLHSLAYTGANTGGQTWVYDPASGQAQLSQLGVGGAFLSVNGSQIGSPGAAVPEPGSILLMLVGAAATMACGRRCR